MLLTELVMTSGPRAPPPFALEIPTLDPDFPRGDGIVIINVTLIIKLKRRRRRFYVFLQHGGVLTVQSR